MLLATQNSAGLICGYWRGELSRCANIRHRRYDSVNTATSRAKLLRLCLFTKSHEWLRPSGAAGIHTARSGVEISPLSLDFK